MGCEAERYECAIKNNCAICCFSYNNPEWYWLPNTFSLCFRNFIVANVTLALLGMSVTDNLVSQTSLNRRKLKYHGERVALFDGHLKRLGD